MKKEYKEAMREPLRWLAVTFALLLLALLLTGCKSSESVVVQHQIERDSIYLTKELRDSIYVLDSVFVREKGDTVTIEKWKVKYVERLLRDTIYKDKVRTETKVVTERVEKKLSLWQRMCIRFFPWTAGILLAIGLWRFRKPALALLRKWVI